VMFLRLNMFEKHNKYTKSTYWLLAINSLIGVCFLGLLILNLAGGKSALEYVFFVVLVAMLFLNGFCAYKIYKRSYIALKLSFWLFLLQVFGFSTSSWAFSLNVGMSFYISFKLDSVELSVNLIAVLIVTIISAAIRSIKKLMQSSDESLVGA
ncbi:hypothetical protein C9I99_26925, partial [Photobacterium lutimaris]